MAKEKKRKEEKEEGKQKRIIIGTVRIFWSIYFSSV
jgi:hypothetical protein